VEVTAISNEIPISALVILLATFVCGADLVMFVSSARPLAKALAAALFGFLGALVYYSAPQPAVSIGRMYLDAFGCALASAGLPFLFQGYIRLVLRRTGDAGRQGYLKVLSGSLWTGNARQRPMTPNDWARRWFVTVSASTGGVVGAVASFPQFWGPMQDGLAPERILFTGLLSAVSLFLVGPVEHYVFHPPHGNEERTDNGEASAIAEMITAGSARATGRLGLVFAALFVANFVHSCFAEGASRLTVSLLATMVVAAVMPGVVTYYWASALQHGADFISKRAGKASALLGGILCLGVAIVLSADAVIPRLGWANPVLNWAVGTASCVLIATILGISYFGSFAFLGGSVLDWTRRRPAMNSWLAIAALAACLAVVAMLVVAATRGIVHTTAPAATPAMRTPCYLPLLFVAGWMVALGFSDFPRIVTEARTTRIPRASVAGQSAGEGFDGHSSGSSK
jgi:hypothetical protein